MATSSNRRPTAEGVLRALADERRQLVLGYLRDRDGSVDIERVATHLADQTGAEESALVTSLHHTHLPALDEVGLVRYDPVVGAVSAADSVTDAADLNEVLREVDRIASGG